MGKKKKQCEYEPAFIIVDGDCGEAADTVDDLDLATDLATEMCGENDDFWGEGREVFIYALTRVVKRTDSEVIDL